MNKNNNSPLRFLALIPPLIGLAVLFTNIFILGVLPDKYVAAAIVAATIAMALILGLLIPRRLVSQIISFVIAFAVTVASGVASTVLITTNLAISEFQNRNIVTSAETGDVNIATTPFVLLVNGLDSGATDNIEGRANSDVNQLLVINPRTHEILIVNTPRDYYVYLHGNTTMRDKLTHAGYYDFETSRLTLEDLYGINIDYYVRVNFDTLRDVVDLIGGIDIESEWEFTTTSHVHVKKGWNHFDGTAALAYSRERKYFGTGDIQRASDQQQIISAIFNKISKNPELLANFTELLNALSGTFVTDINIDHLKELVKLQLDQMPSWSIHTTAVTGTPTYTTEVYSLLSTHKKYYVVVPDESSIAAARQMMLSVLENN